MSKFLTHDEVILAIEARYGKVKVHNVKDSISVEILSEPMPPFEEKHKEDNENAPFILEEDETKPGQRLIIKKKII